MSPKLQTPTPDPSSAPATVPWWRLPIVWMVIGGPLAVVVASFATLALAILNPDPVLSSDPASHASELPALQARNHAATPGH
jgi:hypothetical protein